MTALPDRVRILLDVVTSDMALSRAELRALRDALSVRLGSTTPMGKRTLCLPGEPLPMLEGDGEGG